MILVISTCKEKLNENEFVGPISNIVKGSHLIKHYLELDEKDIEKVSKIIICGTALKDNEYLNNFDKFNWIKNCNKPILGICSGMQILGLSFGAKIIKEKEIGMKKINIEKENKLFSENFEAYELHSNSLKDLENFEIIGRSDKSIQAIKHKNKEFYGIIFHPEVRNHKIIKNFLM